MGILRDIFFSDNKNKDETEAFLTYFVKTLLEVCDKETKSPRGDIDRLMAFTMLNTGQTALKLLDNAQSSWKIMPLLMGLSRVYYETIWRRYLISHYRRPGDNDRITMLFGFVNERTEHILRMFTESGMNGSYVLSHSAGQPYEMIMLDCIKIYIRGQEEVLKASITTDPDLAAAIAFFNFIAEILRSHSISFDKDKLCKSILEQSESAFNMKLLINFSLDKCELVKK